MSQGPSAEISLTAESEEVLADARSAILEVTTQLEIGLAEAVAAYWTDLYEDELEFFIEAVLKRSSADNNIECLKAIVRHYGDPEGDDLWPKIKEILQYRNLVVHRWGHIRAFNGYSPAATAVSCWSSATLRTDEPSTVAAFSRPHGLSPGGKSVSPAVEISQPLLHDNGIQRWVRRPFTERSHAMGLFNEDGRPTYIALAEPSFDTCPIPDIKLFRQDGPMVRWSVSWSPGSKNGSSSLGLTALTVQPS